MAITQTGAMYKSLTFDGKTSREYGVYITGQAVYNAPERDVEMITIPGRNGSFALDNGRFQNITVTYPAGIFADNEADFAQAVSDFRNYLCSRKGYCRLTDEYNPNEYRMAVYKSGLDVDPAQLRAGEFEITFECKPQRWLTSGETATAVANNGTLTNPTLFDSQPLLAIKGYGTIGFNGYEIELENEVLGRVEMFPKFTTEADGYYAVPTLENKQLLEVGDAITVGSPILQYNVKLRAGYSQLTATITGNTGITGSTASLTLGTDKGSVLITLPDLVFNKGTDATYTNTTTVEGTYYTGYTTMTYTLSLNFEIEYQSDILRLRYPSILHAIVEKDKSYLTFGEIYGYSTQSLLGNPTYIDCDLGDAYKIENDVYVSLNYKVDLGSDLPKLASGNNTVAYDNTVTELKITPRWWKV